MSKPNFGFSLFLFSNVVLPVLVIMVLNLGIFSFDVRRMLTVGTVAGIFVLHVYLLKTQSEYRVGIAVIMVLNLLCVFFVGGLNLVTAIPDVPFVIMQYWQILI